MYDYIKSLAKEHYCITEYDIGGKHECYEFSEAELIDFAKMLVLECANVMQKEDSYYGSWMSSVIKTHFGIKE